MSNGDKILVHFETEVGSLVRGEAFVRRTIRDTDKSAVGPREAMERTNWVTLLTGNVPFEAVRNNCGHCRAAQVSIEGH
jgi:hypothetical protein